MESLLSLDEGVICRVGAPLELRLESAAEVSLEVGSSVATARIDGGPAVRLSGVALSPGPHRLLVIPETRRDSRLVDRPFELVAVGASGTATVVGEIRDEIVNRPVLPVGRTFLQGVDLLDGHFVLQQTDLSLEGRHLALELTRSYSSAGRSDRSPVGAGWSLSFDRSLLEAPECGLVSLLTADGGSQTFHATGTGRLQPQRGHHTQLRRLPDGSFDFVDKAGIRHHYAGLVWPGHSRRRLDYIEEPHGDRIALAYDEAGLLRAVHEWHAGVGAVRTLRLDWHAAGGHPRIGSVRAPGLGQRVDYRYDRLGNLILATRQDAEAPASPSRDRYDYATEDGRDPHQLVAILEGGRRQRLEWWKPDEMLPGGDVADGPLAFQPRAEYLHRLEVHSDESGVHEFRYDHREAAAGTLRTEALFGGAATRYVLNLDGNPLEIDSPEGLGRHVTRMTWDHDHVVKRHQEDDRGFSGDYRYDPRGNLTSAAERAAAGEPQETTTWSYDPRFNKLTTRRKPDGSEGRWKLDPRTGDLLEADAEGEAPASYRYDANGCLVEAVEGGERTLYEEPDSYCQATLIRRPDGSVERRRFDERGRRRDPAEDPG